MSDYAPIYSLLAKRLEKSLEGWARMSTEGAWHFFRPWAANPFFLRSCQHCSLLPFHGAKLKKRDELPEGAKVCSDCERRGQ